MLEPGGEVVQVVDVLSLEVRQKLVESVRHQALHCPFKHEKPLNQPSEIQLLRDLLERIHVGIQFHALTFFLRVTLFKELVESGSDEYEEIKPLEGVWLLGCDFFHPRTAFHRSNHLK